MEGMEKKKKRGLRNPKESPATKAAIALGAALSATGAGALATQIEQPAKVEQVKETGAHEVVAAVMKAKPGSERFRRFEKSVFDYLHPTKDPVSVDTIIAKMQTLAQAAGQAGADEDVRQLILNSYVSWVKFKNDPKGENGDEIYTSSVEGSGRSL